VPAKFRRVRAAALTFGITFFPPKRGSHWKAHRDNGTGGYPVPAPNGEKSTISDLYIKKLCVHFDIDLAEFKNEL